MDGYHNEVTSDFDHAFDFSHALVRIKTIKLLCVTQCGYGVKPPGLISQPCPMFTTFMTERNA